MINRFDKTWPTPNAIFLTYVAKKNAEAAAGVGPDTDLHLILPGQGVRHANENDLKELAKIHKEKIKADTRLEIKARNKVNAYLHKLAAQEAIKPNGDAGAAQSTAPIDSLQATR